MSSTNNVPFKPREKLSALGPQELSLAELLAVIFNTGSKQENIQLLAARISNNLEYLQQVVVQDPELIRQQLNVSQYKAQQLTAVLEVGRRLFKPAPKQNFTSPSSVFKYFGFLHQLPREEAHVLYVNIRQELLQHELLTIGSLNTLYIEPRQVLANALHYGAAGIILAHNHPSGSCEPSEADKIATEKLKEGCQIIGIKFIDHLIITKEKYFSFREQVFFTAPQ